eukprot:CAMPEP_0177790316 /NCGR_PEP_ID=MMETSP0491_2-20121128/23277_1 /TAXON_ID=63592 /ORGANISM="Tetraselmis chuii, Strain PLY429" /LENGTH=233 /DNA_ID=CAMNT_0019312357 /DNA_START=256 /DNA_END=957 /DNA_ORIENTATION=-
MQAAATLRQVATLAARKPLAAWKVRCRSAHHKMSWTCHGASNAEMVARLREEGILRSPRLVDAMTAVDRAAFLPESSNSYEDAPQLIGYGVTISAPHMHAYCLQFLAQWLKPGAKVLDVGSGSGYLTAVMAHLIAPGGEVIGIEHIGGLVEQSRESCASLPDTARLMENGTLTLIEGDGRLGYPGEAPYDCIHVGAAAHPFPTALFDQLKTGGRLVIPLGSQSEGQSLALVEK